MTTTYESEEAAIEWLLFKLGLGNDPCYKAVRKGSIMIKEGIIGPPKKLHKYRIKDKSTGKLVKRGDDPVEFGIGRFRDGFDLWILSPEGLHLRL